MTAPIPPPGGPHPDVVTYFQATERTIAGLIKNHKIQAIAICVLAILLLWIVPAHIAAVRQTHADNKVIAALGANAKAETDSATFWRSEATKHATAAVHDTVQVTRVIQGATRYVYTDTGMRVVAPPLAPAAPALDTTSAGHKPLGHEEPYSVIPSSAFYVRASDFDTLAARCTKAQHDFTLEIAALDSSTAHTHKSCDDVARERDTAIKQRDRATHAVLKAEVKAGLVGAGLALLVRSLLH